MKIRPLVLTVLSSLVVMAYTGIVATQIDLSGSWRPLSDQDRAKDGPGPWPDEFGLAMRDGYLRAGPNFQLASMTPRPLDLGPIATLTHWSRMPYVKMTVSWALFGLLLVLLFYLTHQ